MRVVTINVNNRCPLRCRHCSIGFSEENPGDGYRIDAERLKSVIRTIDPATYDVVLLAGGEPSLEVPLIRTAIATAHECALRTAVVTAPVWAASPTAALKFVTNVAGLDVLVLSYDDFHLDFLTDEHYRNAAAAARLAGFAVTFQIVYTREDELRRLELAIAEMGVEAQVHASLAVGVGNATEIGEEERVHVAIDSLAALRSLPRSCVLGNALVDESLGVHGCCWAAAADESRFSEGPGPDGLGADFERLESRPTFRLVKSRGFIDALRDPAAELLLEHVRGQRFATECDLCLAAMTPGADAFWDEVEAASREERASA